MNRQRSDYQSIVLGAGISRSAKPLHFAPPSARLKAIHQLEKDGLVQWPMVMGATFPVVNLEGIKPANVFDANLANIYSADHQWDSAIVQAHPKLKLPTDAIHRGAPLPTASGTTFNFTATCRGGPDEDQVGSGTSVVMAGRRWLQGNNEGVCRHSGQEPRIKSRLFRVRHAKHNKLTYHPWSTRPACAFAPTIAAFRPRRLNAAGKGLPAFDVILTCHP